MVIYKEHAMLNLKHIFTPLETIAPPRTNVTTVEEFLELAEQRHHSQHIFANVHSRERVNKLFFDLDGQFHKVEKDCFVLQNRLIEAGIKEKHILKIWTTKKGLHLYAKIKDIKGLYNPDIKAETKNKLRIFTNSITDGLRTVDSTVMADLNRVSRVAGIQRFDNGLTPIVVPNNEVMKDWLSRQKRWIYLVNRGSEVIKGWGSVVRQEDMASLDDLLSEDDIERYNRNKFQSVKLNNTALSRYETNNYATTNLSREDALYSLEPILKPILRGHYEEFISYKPSHNNRIKCVYLLLEANYSVDMICRYISYLNWDNYDEMRTKNNIINLLNAKKLRS